MAKVRSRDIIEAINTLDHEVLSHRIFLKCFAGAIKSSEIKVLKKSSLFRCTLAYFLLVPKAGQLGLTVCGFGAGGSVWGWRLG